MFVLFTMFNHSAYAKDTKINCNVHKLYCAIVELQPAINKEFAMELSNVLRRKSIEHNTDPYLSIAIAMQESSLLNINRIVKLEEKSEKVCDEFLRCEKTINKIEYVSDFGLFQFSLRTIHDRQLEVERLLNDIDYMVEEHIIFLKEKIRMCSRMYPTTAWGCWHSADHDRHYDYVTRVNRFYKGK